MVLAHRSKKSDGNNNSLDYNKRSEIIWFVVVFITAIPLYDISVYTGLKQRRL